MNYTFTDFYKNNVSLSFADHPFSKHPKHVWVISYYKNKWLLTKHKTRGLEFPGGNVEAGETAVTAANRELMEETGGVAKKIDYIAQYYVQGKREHIIKNVYFAKIARLEKKATYYETEGPVLINNIPEKVKTNQAYSFMMKDDVLTHCLQYIQKHYEL